MASYLTPLPFVRQGYPLSMLLYIIAAEVLASFVIFDKKVKGVQIGDQEIKLVNFADNTTIFLGDIDSLIRLQKILELYEVASSSKINLTKSQTLWSGSYKNRYNKPGKMILSNFSIKILGIISDNFISDNSNWDKIVDNIAKKINIWNRVRLSLRGRKLIINQILLSKLWHIGQIYTVPTYIKKNKLKK